MYIFTLTFALLVGSSLGQSSAKRLLMSCGIQLHYYWMKFLFFFSV